MGFPRSWFVEISHAESELGLVRIADGGGRGWPSRWRRPRYRSSKVRESGCQGSRAKRLIGSPRQIVSYYDGATGCGAGRCDPQGHRETRRAVRRQLRPFLNPIMTTSSEHPASGQTLEIRLLGPLEIRIGGVPVSFSTPRKSLEVLAYLLLNRSAPAGREYLAFLLYPDDEEPSARAKLRATLNDMPKILPAHFAKYVTVDTDKVRWNPDAPLWLDVDAFAAAAADPQRLSTAIDLYRGDLLPQLYDEWIEARRETYRNAYVRCLDAAISAARSKADFPAAIEAARKALALDPYREDVVRRIISIRYQSGDRAGALTEYDAFVKRLRTEMDAEPMAETTALADKIRRGAEPTEEPDALTPSPSALPVLPFVGRESELAQLLECWTRAVQRRGNLAFVGGEGGIGKSRLALEFAHAVEDRGGRVLSGATSFPEAMPYEAVSDALRSAIPLLSALPQKQTLAATRDDRARIASPLLASRTSGVSGR